ncbi:hypothetical protein ACM66B_001883 [Microbotryomycetes sp. NB124-2]
MARDLGKRRATKEEDDDAGMDRPRRSTRTTKRPRPSYFGAGSERGSSDDVDSEDEPPRVNRASKQAPKGSKKKHKKQSGPARTTTTTSVASESTSARDPRGASTLATRARFIGQSFSPGNGQNDYKLTAPEPWRDDDNQYRFDNHPQFLPNLSPEEVIRQGSFGGGYFRPVFSKYSKREVHDDWEDLPREWYAGLEVSEYLTREEGQEKQVNKWKVKVGQSYEEWEKAGWIIPQHDARGWFQWYCRFFRGRRIQGEDERQIGRWERLAGKNGRWRRIYYGKCLQHKLVEIERDDEPASKGIRQTLNHWAYEPNTTHLLEFLESKGVDVANDEEAGDLL